MIFSRRMVQRPPESSRAADSRLSTSLMTRPPTRSPRSMGKSSWAANSSSMKPDPASRDPAAAVVAAVTAAVAAVAAATVVAVAEAAIAAAAVVAEATMAAVAEATAVAAAVAAAVAEATVAAVVVAAETAAVAAVADARSLIVSESPERNRSGLFVVRPLLANARCGPWMVRAAARLWNHRAHQRSKPLCALAALRDL